VREQIGEAADRRHTAPVASVALWALLCGVAVLVAHQITPGVPAHLGPYRTGIVTVLTFVLAALYSARKRTLWISVRWLRWAMRLPRRIALRMVLFDRLETWRTVHITLGVFALLPFWWHVEVGPASRLEVALKVMVLVLVASGLLGTIIHDLLPPQMRKKPDQEVRVQDVDEDYHTLYVEAEEALLGHSEELVHAYLRHVRPLLTGTQPQRKMLWATMTGADPAPALCRPARSASAGLGNDANVYAELVGIAERKIRLEQNRYNLRLGVIWLRFHMGFALIVGILITFHVIGVLYFAGI
jgi:hypothetical protein